MSVPEQQTTDATKQLQVKDTISNLVKTANDLDSVYNELNLGTIEEIFTLVGQLEAKMDKITGELNDTKQNLENTNTKLTEKDSENESLKTEISSINDAIEKLNKMKIEMETLKDKKQLSSIKEKLNTMINGSDSTGTGPSSSSAFSGVSGDAVMSNTANTGMAAVARPGDAPTIEDSSTQRDAPTQTGGKKHRNKHSKRKLKYKKTHKKIIIKPNKRKHKKTRKIMLKRRR